jgi:hypothetical protein
MSPNAEGRGGGSGVSANEYSCADGVQINFGDLAPYLTYASYRHMLNDDINVPRFPHFSMPAIPRLANGLAAQSASKKRPREVLIYGFESGHQL